ncbi:hypothetical protein LIA77_05056 [Sarocladium implicatum]|nr:hypothetical protein LIA77_05056 [Sarocladium implicatum]
MQDEDGWDEMLAFNEQAGNTNPRQAGAELWGEHSKDVVFQRTGALEQAEQRLSQQGAGRASTCPRLAWSEGERRSSRAHARGRCQAAKIAACSTLQSVGGVGAGVDGWWAAGGVWCVVCVWMDQFVVGSEPASEYRGEPNRSMFAFDCGH